VELEPNYEGVRVPYTVPSQVRSYTPDWPIQERLWFETKGRLTSDDRKKLLLVKEQHGNVKLVLVFSKPNNPINRGSKTTYGDWATKNGFTWIGIDEVKENPKCILNIIKSLEGGKSPESPTKKKKS
jgi:hypothetical protein